MSSPVLSSRVMSSRVVPCLVLSCLALFIPYHVGNCMVGFLLLYMGHHLEGFHVESRLVKSRHVESCRALSGLVMSCLVYTLPCGKLHGRVSSSSQDSATIPRA